MHQQKRKRQQWRPLKTKSFAEPNKLSQQNYHTLLAECLKKGCLFEDQSFPADVRSIGTGPLLQELPQWIQWKRPHELHKNPIFYSTNKKRLALCQGLIENCWFLAAVEALTFHEDILLNVVPRNQSFEMKKYAGIFHFKPTKVLANGLVAGHAYAVTGIRKVTCKHGPENLVRLRNPWGKVEWQGDWSDSSGKWELLSPKEKILLRRNSDDGEFCVLVSLIQKHSGKHRNRVPHLHIGLSLYKVDQEFCDNNKKLPPSFFIWNARLGQSLFVNNREVTQDFRLPPGMYVVVPSTLEPHQESEFILRVFSRKHSLRELGGDSSCVLSKEIVDKHEDCKEFFSKYFDQYPEINVVQLQRILNNMASMSGMGF
ncbi:calpain-14 [Crotalus adamanteus]|uniref:Calpain-14 n=1 Tax=Crotalus adamanteus TaxID=8729 RepID=A0AAW1CE17_CROAD